MALSAFEDKSRVPQDSDLAVTLGRARAHWADLKTHVLSEYPPLAEEWNHSGKAYGWSLRIKQKKRVLVYMTPCRGHFLVGLVLGEKAYQAALEARLPGPVFQVLEHAPKYAEGRGFRLEVRTARDLDAIKKLIALKTAS